MRALSLASALCILMALATAGACARPHVRETVTYKRVDGQELRMDVWRPDGGGNGTTLLWLHGGALMHGDRKDIPRYEIDYFCDAGFTLAIADYRVAPETRLPGILEDVKDAVDWLRTTGARDFGVDPGRVVVVGQSAGAYLALTSGYLVTPRPAAIVAYYGFARLDGKWQDGVPPAGTELEEPCEACAETFLSDGVPRSQQRNARMAYTVESRVTGHWKRDLLGDVCSDDDVKCLSRFQPADHVDRDFPPTILLHGDADRDVPLSESRGMAALLRDQGVAHRLVAVRLRQHGFDLDGIQDPEVPRSFDDVIAFLDEQLGSAR